MKKVLKVVVLALFACLVIAGPVLTEEGLCNGKYPNLSSGSLDENNQWVPPEAKYKVKCGAYKDKEGNQIFGTTTAACAQAGAISANAEDCSEADLNNLVQTIITTIIFAVGMIAVVMIILGGVSYATSQGDPSKVKKAKDTILYGIIGLVISLLAFAIVNFVLGALV